VSQLAWLYVSRRGNEGGLPSARYLGVMADAAEIAGATRRLCRGESAARPCRTIGPVATLAAVGVMLTAGCAASSAVNNPDFVTALTEGYPAEVTVNGVVTPAAAGLNRADRNHTRTSTLRFSGHGRGDRSQT